MNIYAFSDEASSRVDDQIRFFSIQKSADIIQSPLASLITEDIMGIRKVKDFEFSVSILE